MTDVKNLKTAVEQKFAHLSVSATINFNELTLEVPKEHLHELCLNLRDQEEFHFEQLMDLCGVDYLTYAQTEWDTEDTTRTGFSRAVEKSQSDHSVWEKPRFAVVYHLLSLQHNHRIRIRSFVDDKDLFMDSVISIWNVANFFEREAFDLYGILFKGHPDLRRILTDYGFIGYPFRKDFPLSGYVEPRYDAALQRVVYEAVDIKPRILVPKVVRNDNRYLNAEQKPAKPE